MQHGIAVRRSHISSSVTRADSSSICLSSLIVYPSFARGMATRKDTEAARQGVRSSIVIEVLPHEMTRRAGVQGTTTVRTMLL